ncbi:inovirus Gp2 family protein [Alcanivorax marinus]|nr:inovirus Gp2 family protein [Alloalcanivorax marinus]
MEPHPDNRNLTLTDSPFWKGWPLCPGHMPFICEYLDRLLETMQEALSAYNRVCAFRFDLHYPPELAVVPESAISRFFHQLQREVEGDMAMRVRRHPCRVRYAWAAERHLSTRNHYHVVILVNKDAYHSWGHFPNLVGGGRDCRYRAGMAHCVIRAWAHALGVPPETVVGSVHFASNGVYYLNNNGPDNSSQFAAIFERASYLAKASTKVYGQGARCFGCSRRRQSSVFQ